MPESGNNLTAVVDLNVWLALVYDGYVHHPTAISWFEQGGRESKASALPGEPSRLAFRGLQDIHAFGLSSSLCRHADITCPLTSVQKLASVPSSLQVSKQRLISLVASS